VAVGIPRGQSLVVSVGSLCKQNRYVSEVTLDGLWEFVLVDKIEDVM
jgi:hypothetical protein